MATETFNKTIASTSGAYSGDYLWSNSANWSSGLPVATTDLTLNLGTASSGSVAAVDQAFTVDSVTWGSAGTLLVGSTLTTNLLNGVASGRTATNLTVLSGGTLTATAGSASIALADTSVLSIAGTVSTGSLSFSAASNYDHSSSIAVSAGSLSASTALNLAGVGTASFAAGTTLNTGTLTLNGATLSLAGNANISTFTYGTGGTIAISGKTTISVLGAGAALTVNQGGSLEVTGYVTSGSGDAFTINGGSLTLDSSVSLNSGSSFTFGATSKGANVALLDIANPSYASGTFSTTLNQLDLGDELQFGTAIFTGATYSNGTLTLTGSKTLALTGVSFATDVGTPNFILGKAANGGTIVTVNCFLAGTRIETEAGELAIEKLRIGDKVVTLEGGRKIEREIVWCGTKRVELCQLDEDSARDAIPVRIRAHAFADHVPMRDLLVTGEHCILHDGVLIPARMLVNGTSISRETDCIAYTVHHLEFDQHAIVLSEGLPTESYTGPADHPGFVACAQARPGMDQGGRGLQQRLAAPRHTDRATVEPVWNRLAARARDLRFEIICPDVPTIVSAPSSSDPDLCIGLGDGIRLQPVRCRGTRHFFMLPAGTGDVVLLSRTAIPAEIEGPFVDDRRRLGVCVRALTLWNDLRSTRLIAGRDGADGWHHADPEDLGRWTNGAGKIVLAELAQSTILEVECTGSLRYEIDVASASRLLA